MICNVTKTFENNCICKHSSQSDASNVIRDCHEVSGANLLESRFSSYKEFKFPPNEHCERSGETGASGNSIELSEDDVLDEYEFNPEPNVVVVPSWPTPKGKTLEFVRNHCTNKIQNSQEGQVCGRLESFKFDTYINQCIEDVKVRRIKCLQSLRSNVSCQ